MAKKQCTVTINEEVLDAIDWFAESLSESRSQMLDYILIDYFKMSRVLKPHVDHSTFEALRSGAMWQEFADYTREKMHEQYLSQFGPDED